MGPDQLNPRSQGPVAKYSPETAASRWLHRRLQCEVLFRTTEGVILASLGLITVAITSCIGAFALLLVLLHFWGTGVVLRSGMFTILFLLLLAFSFSGAYKHAWGMDYSEVKVGWTMPVSGNLLKGAAALACDVLFSGPRLVFAGCGSFGKVLRLLRLDIPQITAIVLWLLEKGTKASVEEVAFKFPDYNAIRILPQLRDIPGVIWLAKVHGVIMLTEEFRDALASSIPGCSEFHGMEGTTSDEDSSGQTRFFTGETDEIAGWYKTLGLPPFAPIHEVKRKYRQLVKLYHPDVTGPKGNETDDRIKEINAAYNNIVKATSNAERKGVDA